MTCPHLTPDEFEKVFDVKLAYISYTTADCPKCGGLMLVQHGVISDFHRTIHAECPAWPEDGKGTASLIIN